MIQGIYSCYWGKEVAYSSSNGAINEEIDNIELVKARAEDSFDKIQWI